MPVVILVLLQHLLLLRLNRLAFGLCGHDVICYLVGRLVDCNAGVAGGW